MGLNNLFLEREYGKVAIEYLVSSNGAGFVSLLLYGNHDRTTFLTEPHSGNVEPGTRPTKPDADRSQPASG